jgi:septal ring factor EnvC (AmiA/AmiB activator)
MTSKVEKSGEDQVQPKKKQSNPNYYKENKDRYIITCLGCDMKYNKNNKVQHNKSARHKLGEMEKRINLVTEEKQKLLNELAEQKQEIMTLKEQLMRTDNEEVHDKLAKYNQVIQKLTLIKSISEL